MTDLIALAERVEALSGPCRETDLALHCALFPDGDIAKTVKRDWRGTGQPGVRSWDLTSHGVFCTETRDERGDVWASGSQPLPHLTGSLDAVTALIAEKLPEWRWEVRRSEAVVARVWRLRRRDESYDRADCESYAATPAIALLAAALRAIDNAP